MLDMVRKKKNKVGRLILALEEPPSRRQYPNDEGKERMVGSKSPLGNALFLPTCYNYFFVGV